MKSKSMYLKRKRGEEIVDALDRLESAPHLKVKATQIFPVDKADNGATQLYDCFAYYSEIEIPQSPNQPVQPKPVTPPKPRTINVGGKDIMVF